MKHLFFINPVAKKIRGRTNKIREMLDAFFDDYPGMDYDVYESKWQRESLIYVRQYITESSEPVRIHIFGGMGTLFEVINSIAKLKDLKPEIAVHPYSNANGFLRYFGKENIKYFMSLKNQVFGKTYPLDIICCGDCYGVCFGIAGTEAYGNTAGEKWINVGMPVDLSYMIHGAIGVLKGKGIQKYSIDIDGHKIEDEFVSILIANIPCYADSFNPAVDAHPDDGIIDVYTVKKDSKLKVLLSMTKYLKGDYKKIPDLIEHYRAKKVTVSSDEVMYMGIDGEVFYSKYMDFKIMSKAVNFVCPEGIDISGLPLIYGRPSEGIKS